MAGQRWRRSLAATLILTSSVGLVSAAPGHTDQTGQPAFAAEALARLARRVSPNAARAATHPLEAALPLSATRSQQASKLRY